MSDDFLHIKIKGAGVADGFRYTFPEDGYKSFSWHYGAWLEDIKNHYSQNGYTLPENWVEIAEDQLCRLLPVGYCEYADGKLPSYFVDGRFTIGDAMNGTMALAKWIGSGFPLVEKSLAEERGSVCAACYANVQVPGCSPCVGFANLVANIVGTNSLTCDAKLEAKTCAYCKCSSRAHVWMPKEVLRAGVSYETLREMPGFCWKQKLLLGET